LRERARREAPPYVLERAERGALANPAGRRLIATWLRTIDRAIPRDTEIDAFLRKARPDVLAVTPLIEPGSPQAEYLRSARGLGIRTAFCVASWDKPHEQRADSRPGRSRRRVERRDEARGCRTTWGSRRSESQSLRGGVRSLVRLATRESRARSSAREQVCGADRPYLLYVCSSKFVAPEEVPFVRRWAEQIRNRRLRSCGTQAYLVRPHPQNAEQWEDVDLSALGAVVWPRAGAAPVDSDTRHDYFESMSYSAAVVGINTTAGD
jgi:hypothetical protein